MNKPLLLAMVLAGTASAVSAQDAGPAKLNTAGALFGVRENVLDIDLSPDGQRVVYVTPGPGRVSIAQVAVVGSSDEPQPVMSSDGNPENIDWCKFVSDARLICRFSGQVNDAGIQVPFSRLVAIGADGKNGAPLGQRASRFDARRRQFDGNILDWLPGENGAVLMAREYVPEAKMGTKLVRSADGTGVDRVDANTMQSTPVIGAIKAADFFISDGRGQVRIKGYQPEEGGSGQLTDRVVYHYRKDGSEDWVEFSDTADSGAFWPIDVDADCNCAYALKTLDGRMALYRVKLDGSMAAELVFKHDKVDVDGVVRIGDGARVIGATYADDKRHVVYFDAEYGNLAKALGKAIPDLPLVYFISSSADNNRVLVLASSDSDPGRYYVFDKTARSLNEILLARPALEGVALASVKPVSYPAADGTAIPGYLTLPPGKETARGLPAVVLPHGGPSARDEWGFDWLAQFLAHQGYAVLQPNYRGSSGYGDAWMQQNGFKGWRTSIGDVTAGGKWLAAQGIADPGKMAIVGWSYGGYAALQSGVLDPGLFKAVVAIAPVTDLALLKDDFRYFTSRRMVAEQVGTGPHITEGSPLQNVSRIGAPVLMFHGDMDLNVGVGHSRRMDAKLREAGKSSELVVYEGLEHGLDDSNARALMLDRIAAFLKTHLGE